MERATGLEPATSSLGSLRSTTELCPHAASSRSQCNGEGQRGQGPAPVPTGAAGGQPRAGGAALGSLLRIGRGPLYSLHQPLRQQPQGCEPLPTPLLLPRPV